MAMFALDPLMRRAIRRGTLHIVDPRGRRHAYGDGDAPRVTVRLTDRALVWRILANPSLAAGEGYMDGRLTLEEGTLVDFLRIACTNFAAFGRRPLGRALTQARLGLRRLQQFNPARRAIDNVAHHYDLSREFYGLFLDRDWQYSCAYFVRGGEDLDTAQELKKRHIAAKLAVRPGMSVLDIGSGWGGLGLYLARESGALITGITLSREQLDVARARCHEAGLEERIRFEIRDYRAQRGRFDRIVSVGMFEHVGAPHFGQFFGQIRDLLADDGVALLHTIGRAEGPGTTDPWIRKYIFPGGYIPALSEVARAIEQAGLFITDIEVLRLHYAETIRHWRMRFQAHRDKAEALYDERFCRMWEYYLAASEASFRYMDNVVFQIQIAKRQDAVPLTRDYITEAERAAARTEALSRRHSA